MEVFITWGWFFWDRQRFEMWCPSIAPSSVPAGQQGVRGRSTSIPLSPADKEQEKGKDDAETITSLPRWSQSSINFSSAEVLISPLPFNRGLARGAVICGLGVQAGRLRHRCPGHRRGAGRSRPFGFLPQGCFQRIGKASKPPALGINVSVIKLSSYPCLLHTHAENVLCNIINHWKYN